VHRGREERLCAAGGVQVHLPRGAGCRRVASSPPAAKARVQLAYGDRPSRAGRGGGSRASRPCVHRCGKQGIRSGARCRKPPPSTRDDEWS
jgi:hypothetical protein